MHSSSQSPHWTHQATTVLQKVKGITNSCSRSIVFTSQLIVHLMTNSSSYLRHSVIACVSTRLCQQMHVPQNLQLHPAPYSPIPLRIYPTLPVTFCMAKSLDQGTRPPPHLPCTAATLHLLPTRHEHTACKTWESPANLLNFYVFVHTLWLVNRMNEFRIRQFGTTCEATWDYNFKQQLQQLMCHTKGSTCW
jgi:hypothetical protein